VFDPDLPPDVLLLVDALALDEAPDVLRHFHLPPENHLRGVTRRLLPALLHEQLVEILPLPPDLQVLEGGHLDLVSELAQVASLGQQEHLRLGGGQGGGRCGGRGFGRLGAVGVKRGLVV